MTVDESCFIYPLKQKAPKIICTLQKLCIYSYIFIADDLQTEVHSKNINAHKCYTKTGIHNIRKSIFSFIDALIQKWVLIIIFSIKQNLSYLQSKN